jgi:hypothetical protein
MNNIFTTEDPTADYASKCSSRKLKLMTVTMMLVDYFKDAGDEDLTARIKVRDISTEVAPYLYAFVLGNSYPLTTKINSSELVFMTETVKADLINMLAYE